MPGLQEWIHSIEEGKGAQWIKRFFMILLFAGLAAAYDAREFKNFATPEAMDMAQLSRNIAQGRGYTTDFIRPLSIRLLRESETDNTLLKRDHPDIANAPVYPFMIAGLMKIFPFEYELPKNQTFHTYRPEIWIAIFNQLLFLCVLIAVYILAKKLFDPDVARITVIIVALTEVFWRFTIANVPTIWMTLLTVLIVLVMTAIEGRIRASQPLSLIDAADAGPVEAPTPVSGGWVLGMSALLGGLVGVGMMTRYSFGWLILPVLAFAAIYYGARRGQAIAMILIAFLVVSGPWLVRNYQLCERPFGLAGFAAMHGTASFTGNKLERSMPADLQLELNKVTLNQYTRKLVENASVLVTEQLPRLGGSWVAALFLVGLLVPFRNPGLGRLRGFLLLTLALFVIVQSIGRTQISEASKEVNSENLLILLAPLVFMFGVGMFYTLIDQLQFAWPQYRTAAIGLFLTIAALPLILMFLPPRSFASAYPPYYPPLIQEVSGWMTEDELMMSDVPWAVAWYGDRKAVWTTLDAGARDGDFFRINDYHKNINALYLTPVTMDARFLSDFLKTQEGAWSRFVLDSMLRTNVPPGFPLKRSPRGFLPDFLFLSDRIRWPVNNP